MVKDNIYNPKIQVVFTKIDQASISKRSESQEAVLEIFHQSWVNTKTFPIFFVDNMTQEGIDFLM